MEKSVTKKKINRYNEEEVRSELSRMKKLNQTTSQHYSCLVKQAKLLGVFVG